MVRKARKIDAAGIGKVLCKSYSISSGKEGKKIFLNERRHGRIFLVAEKDGKIVGLASYATHGLPKHGLAEMDRIALLPDMRGKGIGKMLFHALLDEVKREYRKNGSKLRKLYLLTHADNKKAQCFYKKLGFVHETTLKSHYYEGKDEYVFSILFDCY